ncbi:hypothetical protein IAQ61_005404, partial [Plenodomus lingam]|uniref:Predicted protein n=1 Tax=Leptosphaeria maculans (strain JN3 / isolate v23.1.3 / race Av1-4-5-6-7-8) TaxID=985895 RepID=E4ZZD8_LEPMJ
MYEKPKFEIIAFSSASFTVIYTTLTFFAPQNLHQINNMKSFITLAILGFASSVFAQSGAACPLHAVQVLHAVHKEAVVASLDARPTAVRMRIRTTIKRFHVGAVSSCRTEEVGHQSTLSFNKTWSSETLLSTFILYRNTPSTRF